MKKLHKHIALLLFGIFIFPVLFQPLHVVRHQSHDGFTCSNCCISYDTNRQAETHGESTIEPFKQHCPLCGYEFSITSIPGHFVFECSIEKAETHPVESPVVKPQKPFTGNTSPRAPPVSRV